MTMATTIMTKKMMLLMIMIIYNDDGADNEVHFMLFRTFSKPFELLQYI